MTQARPSGIVGSYLEAARQCGRGVPALLLEALRLRLSAGRLGLTEYLDFRLYRNDQSGAEKRAFAGHRMQRVLEEILVDDTSVFLSLDKVTMYALLRAHALPIPRLHATYSASRPGGEGVAMLHTAAELEQHLRQPGALPVYLKRAYGSYGRGNSLLRECVGDKLVLGNGQALPIGEFCASLDDGKTLGWILQEPLRSHVDLQQACGTDKISGVRVHTFASGGRTHLLRAILKINAGRRDCDNFEHGASGNLLGAVHGGPKPQATSPHNNRRGARKLHWPW